jgi:HEAT repeat protein
MTKTLLMTVVALSVLLPVCITSAQEDRKGQDKAQDRQEEQTQQERIRRLTEKLKDSEPLRRIAAVTELEKMGGAAIKLLVPALKDEDSTVRTTAAEALSRIGDKHIVEPFIEALKDSEPKVRAIAAETLGNLGDARAVERLTVLFKDNQPEVCCAAIEAIVSLGAKDAAQELRKARKHYKCRPVILAADFALAMLAGDEAAFGSVLKALNDDNPEVRRCAARLLGKTGRKEVVEPLIKSMDKWIRQDILQSLKLMGKTAMDELCRISGGKDEALRELALEALSAIGGLEALDILVASLRDKKEGIRGLAAQGLARIGKPAIGALIDLLKDGDIIVRVHAARTLERITEEDFGLDHDKWKEWYEKNK